MPDERKDTKGLCKSNETIAALATPIGRSGVGVVRLSGPTVTFIAEKLLKIKNIHPRHAYYLPFVDQEGETIDQGIAIFFEGPHSFTGEDVLELHAHGGPVVLDALLREIFALGATPANPGEFTQRAFLNNKMDLVQAEAVMDLINASSAQAASSALSSLQGEFSKKIHRLNDKITRLRTYIEAAIDFSEEEIDFLQDKQLSKGLNDTLSELDAISQTAKQGALLQEGMRVVIIGKPNVGKSSLLNCLSGKDSAIVTDIAGTTRDVLREYIDIDGMPLHIIDTAGLQETTDAIEQEGIRRAFLEIEKADKILLIIDASALESQDPLSLHADFLSHTKPTQSITIIKNKIDLTHEAPHIEKHSSYDTVAVSIKKQIGIDLLKQHLKNFMGFQSSSEGIFLARRRHLDALSRAYQFLASAKTQLASQAPVEFIAEELRQAHLALAEIIGEFTTDDLLNEIFSNFCVGK